MPENLAKYSVDIDFKFLNQKNFEKFLKSVDSLGKNLEKSFGDEKKSPLGKAIKNFEKLGNVLSKGTLGRLLTVGGAVSFLSARLRAAGDDLTSLSLYKLRTGEETQGLQRFQVAGASMATKIGKREIQSMLENLRSQSLAPFIGGMPSVASQMLGIKIGATAEENLSQMVKRAQEINKSQAGMGSELLRQSGLDPRLLQLNENELAKYAATFSEAEVQSAEEARRFRNEQLAKLNQNIDRILTPLVNIANYITGGAAGAINWATEHNPLSNQNILRGVSGMQNLFNNTFNIQSTDPKGVADEILHHINNQSNLQAISPNP